MPFSKSNAMGGRIGSVTLLVLLIGVAQHCQASREQQPGAAGLASEVSGSEKTPIDTSINTTGSNEKNSVSTTTSSKGETEDFETADMVDESGHIKFENLRESVQEGVLDGPAPAPSNAFSILPSLVTPALAVSIAVFAMKAL